MKQYPILTHAGYNRGTGGRHTGSFPLHSHKSGELVLILRGSCITTAVGAQTLICPRWSLLVTPPGLEHQQTDTPECDTLYAGFETGDFEFDWTWRLLMFPNDLELYRLLIMLWQRFQRNDLTDETGALIEALLLHVQQHEHNSERYSFFHPAVKRAAEYIENHYRGKISLAEIADYSRISTSRLNVLFRQQFHQSIGEYLLDKRLNLARTLLCNPLYTVSEVAEMCGFSSGNYFIRCFKKRFNTTPGKRS